MPVVPPLKPLDEPLVGATVGPPTIPTLEPVPFGPPADVLITPDADHEIAVVLEELTCNPRAGPPTISSNPPPE
jgi:hypothetical protein